MSRVLTRLGWTTIALAGLLGTSLSAGDLSASLRGGLGTERWDGVKNHLAFGFSYDQEVAKGSSIIMELGYIYQPGTGANKALPQDVQAGLVVAGVSNPSTNFQKLTAQGIVARGFYRTEFSGLWSWQSGLSVGTIKSRMDATGDIRDGIQISTNSTATNFPTGKPAGGWALSPEKSVLAVSPFVGLAYSLGEMGYVEFNLVALNYKQVTLTPANVPGGTTTNRVTAVQGDKSVTHLNLEIGIAFKF